MISMGLLEDAVAEAERTIGMLRASVDDDGVAAIVVCEPSCLSAMKDDWLQLKMSVPLEVRERLAGKAWLVEEFVERAIGESETARQRDSGAGDGSAGWNGGEVIVHGHCHQKALWGVETTAGLVRRMAPGRVTVLDSGCCGMAGSFGYTADRYDLSMRIGELSVFPAVRGAGDGAVIVASGTSCRHQIRDGTGREALHPIELAARVMGCEGV